MGNHVCHAETAHGFTIYENISAHTCSAYVAQYVALGLYCTKSCYTCATCALGLLALVQQMLGSQSDAMHIGQLSCSPAFGAQHPLLVQMNLVV